MHLTIYTMVSILADHGHGHGFDFQWWWMPMMVGMVLFWGLVVVGIVWLVRGGLGPSEPREERRMSAADILERRLAEGDLTIQEYHERLVALTNGPPAES